MKVNIFQKGRILMDENKKKAPVVCLPCGHFEITKNCNTCRYANRRDRKDDGRIHCDGKYGGYNFPENRNGCFYWEED